MLENDAIYKMWLNANSEDEEEHPNNQDERDKRNEFERIFPIYLTEIEYSWGDSTFSLLKIIEMEKNSIFKKVGEKKFKI